MEANLNGEPDGGKSLPHRRKGGGAGSKPYPGELALSELATAFPITKFWKKN